MTPQLSVYHAKRHFNRTPEPKGRVASRKEKALSFVVQKHAARRLHYDFRLELEGTLKSWAVPKGPSLDPREKRLAVHVEDHPLEYGSFEGEIPKGQYGAGTVEIWDRGHWIPEGDPIAGYQKGHLKFRLEGRKLKGAWVLVAMYGPRSDNGENWLLIKEQDHEAPLEERTPKKRGTNRDGEYARFDPANIPGSRKAAMPELIQAELATLAEKVPGGSEWIHEIKFDGYRILARLDNGKIRLFTRRGNDWTTRFPTIASTLKRLDIRQAWLDGEVVVLDEKGVSDFQTLQNAMQEGVPERLIYYVFDLPYAEGYDLRNSPLTSRKGALAALLGGVKAYNPKGRIRYADHIDGEGNEVFQQACKMGLEGVVSKRKDSVYEEGRRSAHWLKIKCLEEQEFVIGGFTEPAGARSEFGALLLGVHERRDGLTYVGRVGTGFSMSSLREIRRKLRGFETPNCPFSNPPKGPEARGKIHWVKPEFVAEIVFSNWTEEGILRQARFEGLREDKSASEVIRERSASTAPAMPAEGTAAKGRSAVAGVHLTNPDRVLYPEQGITKLDLANFYESIADWILPHVVQRPLALLRCPTGYSQNCFFQKHIHEKASEAVRGIEIKEKNETDVYIYIEDLKGLISLVQMGVLEFHPWGSRIETLEQPDRITFDLDPSPGLDWAKIIDAAKELRERLSALKLASFVKTTGGKGLHVVVPIEPKASWVEVKEFSKRVAEAMAQDSPERYTANLLKAKRTGKIFVDYIRNNRGATAVAAYSTRARPGAPVSTPLDWKELSPKLKSDHFNVTNIFKRLKAAKDPWERFGFLRQRLPSKV